MPGQAHNYCVRQKQR